MDNTRKHRLREALGVVVLALAVAACGGAPAQEAPAAPENHRITVVATEFTFEPVTIEVPADTPFELVLENRGVVEHDLIIHDLGIQIHAEPGETVSATVTVPAGTYHVHCTIPGHQEAGMEATLVAR